jgi:hypothetical protein
LPFIVGSPSLRGLTCPQPLSGIGWRTKYLPFIVDSPSPTDDVLGLYLKEIGGQNTCHVLLGVLLQEVDHILGLNLEEIEGLEHGAQNFRCFISQRKLKKQRNKTNF